MRVAATTWRSSVVVLVLAAVVACSAGGTPRGTAATGALLFRGTPALGEGIAGACSNCHAVAAGQQAGIGPNLSNIGGRAATAVAGEDASSFLRESILQPDAHLADNYQEGIMPRTYAQSLSAQQIADLVAYLLTLKSGQD